MERFGFRKKLHFKISKKHFWVLFLVIIICGVLLLKYLNQLVAKTLHALCEVKVESIGIALSNKAIDDVMKGITYEDLIHFIKDDSGKIIALKSDVVEMNKISAEIAEELQRMYDELDDIYVYVPLGNFTGNDFLAGHGPNIRIKVMPAGTVNTAFKTEFVSAGINQTRHRVYINVICHMRVIAPFASDDVIVDNGVTVAETVLIGDVPNYYSGN